MASRPETIKKMQLARKLKNNGLTTEQIAKKMNLSISRINELIQGYNWYSKLGKKVAIKP